MWKSRKGDRNEKLVEVEDLLDQHCHVGGGQCDGSALNTRGDAVFGGGEYRAAVLHAHWDRQRK